MDPNETLEDIRGVFQLFKDKRAGILELEDLAYAIQQFQNLDEWLSKGGFLPESWATDTVKRQMGD